MRPARRAATHPILLSRRLDRAGTCGPYGGDCGVGIDPFVDQKPRGDHSGAAEAAAAVNQDIVSGPQSFTDLSALPRPGAFEAPIRNADVAD